MASKEKDKNSYEERLRKAYEGYKSGGDSKKGPKIEADNGPVIIIPGDIENTSTNPIVLGNPQGTRIAGDVAKPEGIQGPKPIFVSPEGLHETGKAGVTNSWLGRVADAYQKFQKGSVNTIVDPGATATAVGETAFEGLKSAVDPEKPTPPPGVIAGQPAPVAPPPSINPVERVGPGADPSLPTMPGPGGSSGNPLGSPMPMGGGAGGSGGGGGAGGGGVGVPSSGFMDEAQALMEPYDQAEQGVRDAYGQEQAAFEAQKKFYYEAAKQQQAQADATLLAEKERQQELSKYQNVFNQAVTELAEKKELDPKRWWTKKDTAGKIGTILGTFFTGIGMGLAGKPELATQNIVREMEMDLEAQKADYAKTRDVVDAANSAFGHAMRMVGDQRQAESLAKAAMLERIETDAKGRLSDIQAGKGRMEMEQFIARLQEKRSEALLEAFTRFNTRKGGRGGGGGGGGGIGGAGGMQLTEQGQIVDPTRVATISDDGSIGIQLGTTEMANTVNKELGNLRIVKQKVRELAGLDQAAKKNPKLLLDPNFHRQRQMLISSSLQRVATLEGSGVINKWEIEPALHKLGAIQGVGYVAGQAGVPFVADPAQAAQEALNALDKIPAQIMAQSPGLIVKRGGMFTKREGKHGPMYGETAWVATPAMQAQPQGTPQATPTFSVPTTPISPSKPKK